MKNNNATNQPTMTTSTHKSSKSVINHDVVDNLMSNPNTACILQALFGTGPLADFKSIDLTGDYAEDYDSAYLHPEHNNEALVYSKSFDMWSVLDCCGDQYSFSTLHEALAEFLSPMGHMMWLDTQACGQHRPALYFAS